MPTLSTPPVRRVRVLWPDRKERLVWRWAYQCGDDPAQATARLARNWHKTHAQR